MSNYKKIVAELSLTHTSLVAVTKTRTAKDIMELYQQGQRVMGENRVQELLSKHTQLPPDIEWHLIGHLQTNKIKEVVGIASVIHSVDSWRVLLEIIKHAQKKHAPTQVLLQYKIAAEATKHGLSFEESDVLLQQYFKEKNDYVKIVGVMGMATNTDDVQQVELEFLSLAQHFKWLKSTFFKDEISFKHLSMGMSDDYRIAVACGSTMVRIGSLLFIN